MLTYDTDFLQCLIDICLYYPLEDVDIFLQVDPPQESGYQFPNQKEVIGSNPGVSNKISKIDCLPRKVNTFNVNSIKNNGWIEKKNSFTIYGEWENNRRLPPLEFDFQFFLENNKKDLVDCKYKKDSNSNYMECQFDGEGKFKIDEQYFNGFLITYQFNTFDNGITVKSCNKGTNDSYRLYFNLLNTLISILLLF